MYGTPLTSTTISLLLKHAPRPIFLIHQKKKDFYQVIHELWLMAFGLHKWKCLLKTNFSKKVKSYRPRQGCPKLPPGRSPGVKAVAHDVQGLDALWPTALWPKVGHFTFLANFFRKKKLATKHPTPVTNLK